MKPSSHFAADLRRRLQRSQKMSELGAAQGLMRATSTARIASAACPQVFSLHTLLSKHDNFCAHLDPIGKINDVLVGHPNAAGRHGGPDCIWLVRPMNAIEA